MAAENLVDAASVLSENLDVEEVLIDFGVHDPDIATLKPEHYINTVVVLVWSYEA